MSTKIKLQKENPELLEISPEEMLSRVSSYNLSYSVTTLLDLINRSELELEPEFQRYFVWDKKRASLFIDSLLIGLPTPSLFFGRNRSKEDFVVIDGLQRLKTIFFFFKGEFSNEKGDSAFRLIGLTGRPWNRCSYEELSLELKRRLQNAVINVTVIDDVDLNPDVVHELFYRINTGGVTLTNQEVRNCVYGGPFNTALHKLNRYDNWRHLLGSSIIDKRLADVELILRFFALYVNWENYRPPMREFLSRFQAENREKENKELENVFKETVDTIFRNIGEDAFKKTKVINKALLESLMVAIATNLRHLNNENVKRNYKELIEFFENENRLLYANTFSEINIRHRISIAIEIMGE